MNRTVAVAVMIAGLLAPGALAAVCDVRPISPEVPPGDLVLIEDEMPAWATTVDAAWDATQHATGAASIMTESVESWNGFALKVDRHGWTYPPNLDADKTLVAYALINGCQPAPRALRIDVTTGWVPDRSYVLYWGDASVLDLPPIDPPAAIRIGDVPASGQWMRLEIPVAMTIANPSLYSIGFGAYGGQVWWDHVALGPGPVAARISAEKVPSFSRMAGTSLTWTVHALGGAPPIQYQFEQSDGSAWTLVQAYSTNNSYSWTPGLGDMGDHAIRVSVRNAASTAEWEDRRTYPISIRVLERDTERLLP